MYKKVKKILHLINDKRSMKLLIILLFFSSFIESIGIGIIFYLSKIISQLMISNEDLEIKIFSIDILIKSNYLIYFLFFAVVLFLLKNFFLLIVNFFQSKFIYDNYQILSNKIYNLYLNEDYETIIKIDASVISKNIMVEIYQYITKALQPLMIFLTEFFVLLILVIILFALNFWITTFITSTFFLIFAVYYMFSKNYINKWGNLRQLSDTIKSRIINDSFFSISERKIFNLEEFFKIEFDHSNNNSSKMFRNSYFVSTVPRNIIEVALIALAIYMFLYTYQNKNIDLLSLGAIYLYAAYRFSSSISRVVGSIQNIEFSDKITNQLNLIFERLKKNEKFIKKEHLKTISFKNLTVQNVCFSYGKKEILSDINLHLSSSKIIGLLGESGSGKSTFLNLLVGLLNPSQGTINFNDTIINEKNILSYQSKISYVPQKPAIFNDSIKKNIILYQNFDEEKFHKIIKLFAIDNFINFKENEHEINIGERGLKLSGGQIQRIGLARAFYKRSDLIILDECTNALDLKSEERIFDILNKLKKDKLIIVVSHNTETLKKFSDEIYQILDGKIVKCQ